MISCDDVKNLVQARLRDEVELAWASELVAAAVDGHHGATDKHTVDWAADRWLSATVWNEAERDVLERLASELPTAERPAFRSISRAAVFHRRTAEPLEMYLAVMAWGHGDTGYGWHRTADVLRDSRHSDPGRLGNVVDQLRSWDGHETAFRAWSRDGDAKLHGIGTAFASKLAYFLAYDREAGRGPLIADANTGWGIWALAGISDSPSSASQYVRYLEQAETWSDEIRCRSDDVERALFEFGKSVRKVCQQLRGG